MLACPPGCRAPQSSIGIGSESLRESQEPTISAVESSALPILPFALRVTRQNEPIRLPPKPSEPRNGWFWRALLIRELPPSPIADHHIMRRDGKGEVFADQRKALWSCPLGDDLATHSSHAPGLCPLNRPLGVASGGWQVTTFLWRAIPAALLGSIFLSCEPQRQLAPRGDSHRGRFFSDDFNP